MNNLLLRLQTSIKGVVIIVLMMLVNNGIAKSYNWDNITQQQYIDNLVECKTILDELKWSYNVWPKENKTTKPKFVDVVDREQIRQSVLKNLKMQAVLLYTFNFEITYKMLQRDLDRMAQNTKNVNRLKEIFAVLNNNPETIAQCISRPYLVEKKLTNQFSYSNQIHEEMRIIAEIELDNFLSNNLAKNIYAAENTVTYKLKIDSQSQNNISKITQETQSTIIELDEKEFQHKRQQLSNKISPEIDAPQLLNIQLSKQPSIQQSQYSFYYSKIIEQTEDSLMVKTLSWQKQSQNQWLKIQADELYQYTNTQEELSLPTMKASNKTFNANTIKSTSNDTWEQKDSSPNARHYHTAIWSGSEMVVWGGSGNGGSLNTGGRYNPSTDSWSATSLSNAPAVRSSHSAIWSGSEMVVWGGSVNGIRLNTGGRYNPITDMWVVTSLTNAPTVRLEHTAIWSGSEMVVWGGDGNIGKLNSGGRYNPNTDTWVATSLTNAPASRKWHTAIWSGSEMVIWGGLGIGGRLNTGGRYNPSTDTWVATSLSDAPAVRNLHSAIWSGSEMIVWGGFGGGFLNTGGRYNPSTDMWVATSLSNAPTARIEHTAIWSGSEVVLWGGLDSSITSLNTGGRYNPSTDSWSATSLSNAPAVRNSHSAIWSGSEMVVWGGSVNGVRLNTGGRYNPSTDTWVATSLSNAPAARYSHSAIWSGNEMVVWGGIDGGNSGGRYNPSTDSWSATSLSNAPAARYYHSAIWSGSEVVVWGGSGNGGRLNTGGRYNPSTDIWVATSLTNAPAARYFHTGIWSGSEMVVWGGLDSSNTSLNTGGRYNLSTDTWVATSLINVSAARHYHTAIWSGSEMVVWGGFGGSLLNTGGRYNPSTDMWVATSLINAPASRQWHTGTWSGSEMVVWGGLDSSNTSLNTGGRYNPSTDTWVATSQTNAPAARYFHTGIWSGSEMVVWGGLDSPNTSLNTGGRYNPSTDMWVATSLINVPVARRFHTAVLADSEMIVWAGYDGGSLVSMGIYSLNSSYELGGNLTGLNGNQVILQNNGGDDLTLSADGAFTFANAITEGGSYTVTVLTNPTSPAQTCSVTNGTGMNIMANFNNIQVTCVDNSHNINVTVTGLDATNSIEVTSNGQSLNFTGPGGPTNFATPIFEGLTYAVQVTSDPTSPNQTCTVTGGGNSDGSGTMGTMDVAVTVNCVTTQYDINVTITGLAATNTISFANSGDTLSISSNTTATLSTLNDGTAYNVTIFGNQPDTPTQTCAFTSANSGTLSGANVTITVYCNTELTAVNDVYTAFEDITLVANDANGSVVGVNDDGVLVNDSDVDGDTLSVANTGTFTATGLTGDVTIAADGTFSYVPPANVSGQDMLSIQVTDGIHNVPSNITIDVLPVNDAPTFTIMGNVLSAELDPNIVNTTLTIAQFATMIDAGAPDESGQTLQFNANIFAGSSVVNAVTLSNTGDLNLNFTGNIGLAIIQLTLQDDGLTTNGGEDTSVVTEFVVSYSDVMFSDDFESTVLLKTQGLFASKLQQIPSKDSVIYQEETDSVKFLGHQLNLNGMDRAKALDLVKSWMQVLLLVQQSQE